MSAAQTPGTPTTTEAAAPAAEAGSGDTLADALAEFTGTPEAEATPAPEKAEPAKTEEAEKKPEPEQKDGKRKRQEFEAYLLSEGVLGTKDGIEKASQHFRRRQSKIDGIEVRQVETARELHEAKTTIQQAYEQAQAELDTDRRRAAAIRQIDDKLANGTVEEMLETLGKIRGKSGREVWDQMARVAIKMGQAAPVAAPAEVQRLEGRIEQLQEYIREHFDAQAQAAESGEAAQLEAGLKEREAAVIAVASDATKHPELARYVKLGLQENIIVEVVKAKRAARAAGRQLDNAGALASIEAELRKLPAGATPASPASARLASPAAAIADDVPITGIAPSQTRSAGSVRDKTEAELAEDLAKDPGFFRDFLGIEV